MKKASLLCLTLILFLCACTYTNSATTTEGANPTNNDLTAHKPAQGSGEYPDYIEFTSGYYYDEDIIQNADAAVNLASTIFSNIEKGPDQDNYIPRIVYNDTEDHLWIVSFWSKEQADNILDGYAVRIILDAKSGAVKSIYSNTPMPKAIFREFNSIGDGSVVPGDIS